MAHELGHAAGLQHAPCGQVGATADPNYPTYEPYTPASIGEFGLDIDDGTVHLPLTDTDFMSYCGPNWISVYSHNKMFNNATLGGGPCYWSVTRSDSSWARSARATNLGYRPCFADRRRRGAKC